MLANCASLREGSGEGSSPSLKVAPSLHVIIQPRINQVSSALKIGPENSQSTLSLGTAVAPGTSVVEPA